MTPQEVDRMGWDGIGCGLGLELGLGSRLNADGIELDWIGIGLVWEGICLHRPPEEEMHWVSILGIAA